MNPYVIIGVVVAIGVAGAGGLYQGHQLGKAEVQQAWDKEKAEQYAQYAKAQEEARANALSNSLQQRQTRPTETSSLPNSSGTRPASCSGKELYREDGEFLVRIAREADELRSALKQCYTQYEALRR